MTSLPRRLRRLAKLSISSLALEEFSDIEKLRAYASAMSHFIVLSSSYSSERDIYEQVIYDPLGTILPVLAESDEPPSYTLYFFKRDRAPNIRESLYGAVIAHHAETDEQLKALRALAFNIGEQGSQGPVGPIGAPGQPGPTYTAGRGLCLSGTEFSVLPRTWN